MRSIHRLARGRTFLLRRTVRRRIPRQRSKESKTAGLASSKKRPFTALEEKKEPTKTIRFAVADEGARRNPARNARRSGPYRETTNDESEQESEGFVSDASSAGARVVSEPSVAKRPAPKTVAKQPNAPKAGQVRLFRAAVLSTLPGAMCGVSCSLQFDESSVQ